MDVGAAHYLGSYGLGGGIIAYGPVQEDSDIERRCDKERTRSDSIMTSGSYTSQHSKGYYLLRYSIIIVFSALLVILTFLILRGTRSVFGIDTNIAGWTIRAIIVLATGFVLYSSRKGLGQRYRIDGYTLSITQYWLGAKKSEEVITLNPETVHTIRVHQTALDKFLHSGTVSIEIDGANHRIYDLEHVDNPRVVMRKLIELKQSKNKN